MGFAGQTLVGAAPLSDMEPKRVEGLPHWQQPTSTAAWEPAYATPPLSEEDAPPGLSRESSQGPWTESACGLPWMLDSSEQLCSFFADADADDLERQAAELQAAALRVRMAAQQARAEEEWERVKKAWDETKDEEDGDADEERSEPSTGTGAAFTPLAADFGMDMMQFRNWADLAGFDNQTMGGAYPVDWTYWGGVDSLELTSQESTGGFSDDEYARTTVMIRNLPNDYSRDMLLQLLNSNGFGGSYDFVYYPIDFKRCAAFGYAFVNMVSHSEALRVRAELQGYCRWEVPSQKVVDVCWGHPLQGWSAMVERYRNSPVMHESVPDKFKPVVFCNGVRVAFPPPTKRIRNPRRKTGRADAAGNDQTYYAVW